MRGGDVRHGADWADPKLARQTYNARTETVATRPSFRNAWQRKQFCIIPAQYRGWLKGDLGGDADVYRPFPADQLVAAADPLLPRTKAKSVVEPGLL